ncbi:hypothetical protein [Pseudokineococcus sp. 1T1Z-3]|uniref:hypothetical protein n=1 Tax=Pseudokineococcus sp. 1T1Z-3 TaxID=3132745 RepID=UPI003099F864
MEPVWTPAVSLGAWLAPRLTESGAGGAPVTSFVPSGYEAYARVLHPVGDDGSPEQTTWAQVCEATGRTAHPLMQWEAISGTSRTRRTRTTEWEGEEPEQGDLQPTALAALLDVLGSWTPAEQEHVMALWEGHGWVDGRGVGFYGDGEDPGPVPPAFSADVLGGPRLQLPGRGYLLFTGPLAAAARLGRRTCADVAEVWPGEWLWRQSPALLWPHDRSWCLSTEVDLDSTLVGGPASLVEAVVASTALEAHRVPPDGDLSDGGDSVNPPPGRRR